MCLRKEARRNEGRNMTELALQLQRAARKALSDRRFRHVQGVVETAVTLARHYHLPEEKAELAGWLHDLAREWPTERLAQEAEQIEVPSGFATIPMLLHGPVAAHMGRVEYGILDEDILNAVIYHTSGRMAMSELEKILFIADAVEPGRSYPGVDSIRQLAFSDLDSAVLRCLESSILYLLERGEPIFPLTVMARNEYLMYTNSKPKTTAAMPKQGAVE